MAGKIPDEIGEVMPREIFGEIPERVLKQISEAFLEEFGGIILIEISAELPGEFLEEQLKKKPAVGFDDFSGKIRKFRKKSLD